MPIFRCLAWRKLVLINTQTNTRINIQTATVGWLEKNWYGPQVCPTYDILYIALSTTNLKPVKNGIRMILKFNDDSTCIDLMFKTHFMGVWKLPF